MAVPRKRSVKIVEEQLTPAPLLSELAPQVPFSKETKLYCFDCHKLAIQKDMHKSKEDAYYCQKCWKRH